MEPIDMDHYQPSQIEKWLFRALLGILIMLVGWVGNRAIASQDATTKSVNDLTSKVAVLSIQLADLSSQVSSATTLAQQVALMQQIQQDHEKRLQKLETEVGNGYGRR